MWDWFNQQLDTWVRQDLSSLIGANNANNDINWLLARSQEAERFASWGISMFGREISGALDAIPILGNLKMILEGIFGEDLITGAPLDGWQRAISIGLGMLPLVSAWAEVSFGGATGSLDATAANIADHGLADAAAESEAAAVKYGADETVSELNGGVDAAGAENEAVSGGGSSSEGSFGGSGEGDICSLADSFDANTPVETDGQGDTTPISNLKVGDHVLAYNQDTGATGSYTVTAVLVHTDPTEVYLTIDGEQIETTPEHPFYTLEYGWVNAGDLQLGEHIRRDDGSYGTVMTIKVKQYQQVMYNLTVDTAHTFFVGVDHWLVHNKICINVSKSKYPQSAQHIEDAQKAGKPTTLTINRTGAKANRAASLKGKPKVPNRDLDEYPPAMFKEGGNGASVRAIDPSDNRGAGSSMGHQCRKYLNGTQVDICVVP